MTPTRFVAIVGNTYPFKDQLQAMGARWNPGEKLWFVPSDRAALAQKLVDSAPVKRKRSGALRGICAHCGAHCSPGYRTCKECAHGGQSYYDRNGNFVLGSDD